VIDDDAFTCSMKKKKNNIIHKLRMALI